MEQQERNIPRLSPPPRSVPISVKLGLLFGGFLNQLGWFFVGFGSILCWVFLSSADLTSFYQFRGEIETVSGVVTDSKRTNAYEGSGRRPMHGRRGIGHGTRRTTYSETGRKTPIYANYYKFTGPDGKEYTGISYATGRKLQKGQSVTIEFPKGNPSVSRIKGMRRAIFGPAVSFVALFPLIGIVLVFFGLKNGIKANRLLAMGELATGTLKSKVATGTKVNNRPVYELTFEFKADDGNTYEVKTRTHQPELLTDQQQETLLYDPFNPNYAVMLDSLPSAPEIDETGNLRPRNPLRMLLVLILPFLSLGGNGVYVYLNYLR